MTSSAKGSSSRLLELDALRGLAALAVVLYHYFYRYNELYGHHGSFAVDWTYFGKLGVELFFMVSGFVIFMSLNRVNRPVDFLVSRFSRLYPTYWCALILTFTVVSIWGLPGREISTGHAILNVLMFQEYLMVPHVDNVYWTLTTELTFYFWMFALFLTGKMHRLEQIALLILAVALLNASEVIAIPKAIQKLFFLRHFAFFVAGICFYKMVHQQATSWTYATLGMSLIVIYAVFPSPFILVFIPMFAIFYLAVSGHLRFLSNPLLLYFGSISYALYLVHQNIGFVIIREFYERAWHPMVAIVMAIGISILLATALTRWIEQPALKLIRKYWKSSVVQRFVTHLPLLGTPKSGV